MSQEPELVLWTVVRGVNPFTRAVEPGAAGVTVPDDVLAWAAGHGLSIDDPDVYILVTTGSDAGGISGRPAPARTGYLPAAAAAAVRAAVEDRDG